MTDRRLSPALLTDLYQLTMAQAYWQAGHRAPATFSLTVRSYPPDRGYLVFAGLADVLSYLEELRFSRDDLELLRSWGMFDDGFLEALGGLRFTGSVRAMAEGTIFFIDEPVIEVTAPVTEAQIAETFVLNQINLQSMLATKASRVVHAARGRAVVDFGARRTHGVDAANKFARVSYLAGFAGTSNVMAAGLYGIPAYGTMAHSFVETFPHEIDSFRAYGRSFPDRTTLLVDTYDTIAGVRNAIEVAKEMKAAGHALRAVRLDSGDLLDLSLRSRALLDEAGLQRVEVFASGGLDEFEVDRLLAAGAPIDGFGVGTKAGVSADAPWTDCAYKLVEYDGRPTLKLSTAKQTLPGPKQVYRIGDGGGLREGIVATAGERPPGPDAEPLLVEVMREGRQLDGDPPLDTLRERFARELETLPDECKALRSPGRYRVSTSSRLSRLHAQTVEEARGREGLA